MLQNEWEQYAQPFEMDPPPKSIRCESEKLEPNRRFPFDHYCKHSKGHSGPHECGSYNCDMQWTTEQQTNSKTEKGKK